MRLIGRSLDYFFFTLCVLLVLTTSEVRLPEIDDQVHILASSDGFDLMTYTREAVWLKMSHSAIATPRYILPSTQRQIVLDYLDLVEEIQTTERDINLIYMDPAQADPDSASSQLRETLEQLQRRQAALAPIAEAVLEMQITSILVDLDLTTGGQPIPWVLYHTTPLPQNLVISPRNEIRQETNYLLRPDLSIDEAAALEAAVSEKLDVSTLVVNVGGLAAYPTMIMRTSAFDWLSNTIAHEWIHLYLAQRPLGINYTTTAELRTMNETTASIAGDEIGRLMLERFYPELVDRYPPEQQLAALGNGPIPPGSYLKPFDFRAEMHETRVRADELLAAGKIEEAEAYMEYRREVFFANGYPLRKINQAYFAFYGAYANTPGGAAGQDPVGPAVRALREQSQSLTDFLERIGQMSSFEELQEAVGTAVP